MYFLYTDETNVEQTHDFFVYAGVAIPAKKAHNLSGEIEEIRKRYGYRPHDPLKFNTHDRPLHISQEHHTNAKRALIRAAGENDVKLFASMVLHSISKTMSQARAFEINRVCYHFNCFLNRVDAKGIVFVDTFDDGTLTNILKEKFQKGLIWDRQGSSSRMKHILGYHPASIGTSHFSSVVDVVLGSFRFVVNNHAEESRRTVMTELVDQLTPMWYRDTDERVHQISLYFSPDVVKVSSYWEKYKALRVSLRGMGLKMAHRNKLLD